MRILFSVVFAAVLLSAPAAEAHKVIASLYPGNGVVEGEVGFSNGDMAVNALIEVFDADGKKLGETRTDEDGFFTYRPAAKTDLVFRSNLGAGHIAVMHLAADEVLLAEGESSAAGAQSIQAIGGKAALRADQRALIAAEVRRAIRPLQREISAYKEKNDMQSILGGLGYIAGLFGVGFYLAARRRQAGA